MKYETAKRIIDFFGAIFLICLFSPVMLLTAVAIKVTSSGPVFADIPKRVGKNGKNFYPYKFRSMIVNAYHLLKIDPKFKKAYLEQQTSGNYKIKNDPRVTSVGKFIRKYSIDEMPQLLNVLKGEMSIIGPRPYYKEELERQERVYPGTKRFIREALKVRPGITGYWQVTGRSDVNFDKRIEMDAYYARKKSLLFDFLIILKTPWAMMSGKGAA
jgi:lipopolysaccharide/colanic/teichoic acid biosynthesis glycosyltransferase